MRLESFSIRGLGHLSTLIADDEAGVAAVVDPRRDVDIYLDAAAQADLRISHVVETHLHNDYVSGGRELAALTGATHVIGAGAELRYEHGRLPRRRRVRCRARCGSRCWTRPATRRSTSRTRWRTRIRAGRPGPAADRRARSWWGRSGGRTCSARTTPCRTRTTCTARSTTRCCRTATRSRPPDPRRRVAVLDRDRSTLVDDDRLRAAPRPAAGPDGRRRLRAGAPRRPAGDPALLRADATDEPGRAAAARRHRAGHAPLDRRRSRRRSPPARWSSTPGRPRPTPRQRIPGSLSIPLGTRSGHGSAGWWTRPAGRADRRTTRPTSTIVRQAIRIGARRSSATSAAGFRRGADPGRVDPERAGCRVDELASQLAACGAATRPSSSTSARRTSTRPATSRARGTSTAGSLPAMLDGAAARPPDRGDLCQRLPRERRRRRCSARPASSASWRGRRRAARTGEARGYAGSRVRRRTTPTGDRSRCRSGLGARRTRTGRGPWPADLDAGWPAPSRLRRRGRRQAERGDPEQDGVEGDDRPTADQASTLPIRPLRCSPISRWSLTSRTMNTSTIGSSRPCRFCEPMISGRRSSPGMSTTSAPATQHERVDREERAGVGEALVDAGLPAERLADHERGRERHDRGGQHARPEQPDREERLGQPAGDRLEGPRRVGRGRDRPAGRRRWSSRWRPR